MGVSYNGSILNWRYLKLRGSLRKLLNLESIKERLFFLEKKIFLFVIYVDYK